MIMASKPVIRMDKPMIFAVHPIREDAPTRRMAMRMKKKIQKRYDFDFSPPSVSVCVVIGVGGFEKIFFSSLLNETERIIPMMLAKLTERIMRASAKSAPINPPV
jgi:hypothetical protein